MFSDHCKSLELLSVSSQRGKHQTAMPWGWLNRRDPDISGTTKSEYKKPQFLWDESILAIVLGGHENIRFIKEKVTVFSLTLHMSQKRSINPGLRGPGH